MVATTHPMYCRFALNENLLFVSSLDLLIRLGAVSGERIVQHKEVCRLVSGMWLHSGLLHLIVNMVSLLAIGCHMECVHGCLRIGLVYITAGIVGSLASAISAPSSASVGTSGAVVGLLGAALVDILMNRAVHGAPVTSWCRVCLVVAIQTWTCTAAVTEAAMGTSPSFEYVACVFSFLRGFAMSFKAGLPQHRSSVWARRQPSAVGSRGHDSVH